MKTSLLSSTKDPMGTAIADYYKQGKAAKLRVFSSQFEEDEIPVAQLFRSYEQMPPLEQKALQLAQGKILDCGAGSGCHALALQAMGKEVQAIDISPLSVETMRLRGVKQAYQVNLFDENYVEQFDTILLLMNGSGIIGKLANMSAFFNKMKQLLTPDLADDYYGEIDFQMQYKQIKGEPFDWLYIDFQTLSLYAAQNGFTAELIQEGEHYDYLARLKRQSH